MEYKSREFCRAGERALPSRHSQAAGKGIYFESVSYNIVEEKPIWV